MHYRSSWIISWIFVNQNFPISKIVLTEFFRLMKINLLFSKKIIFKIRLNLKEREKRTILSNFDIQIL